MSAQNVVKPTDSFLEERLLASDVQDTSASDLGFGILLGVIIILVGIGLVFYFVFDAKIMAFMFCGIAAILTLIGVFLVYNMDYIAAKFRK